VGRRSTSGRFAVMAKVKTALEEWTAEALKVVSEESPAKVPLHV
jgi:hypothetical protein